ncbi:putative lipoprotein with Yx(FWY)xxD motif [Actinoplanes lutulentus]|nr:putative lipoprotein with Yx(FWY)xxD motif [Actinoplanes lutulentus]
MMVLGAALAAIVALPGCAPAGYGENTAAADYGNAAEPASNEVAATPGAADATAEADPDSTAEADPDSTEEAAPADEANTPEISEELTTTELTATKVAKMGETVQDQDGFVLYRFDKDEDDPAKSNCNGDCAAIWPAALTNDGTPTLDGVDESLVGTVTRADGTKQLTLKGWPLYRYIGDKKPGQWKGQNVSGTWFVITPEGTKNLTCLPKISKPVAPPAAEDAESSDEASDTGSDYSY